MEYFSINAFILGTLLFACLYLSNIVYSLLCFVWKIKIVEFAIFANAWFSLYKETILGTKFILGWLPLSGYIKPLGMTTDKEEKNKISQNDLPYSFFNKPKYLQTIFRLVPWIIYCIALVTAIIILNNSSVISTLQQIVGYAVEAFKTMFSDSTNRQQFVTTTKEIIEGKNIVVFAFSILVLVMLLFTPITAILNWFSADDKKKNKLQKALGFIVTILIFWFILWKLPKFIFSFFTFSQSLIYISSFIIGMFAVGLLFFFATIFVVKSVSQNLNDNKIK